MCWMCDRDSTYLAKYWSDSSVGSVHLTAYAAGEDALPADGVGDDVKPPATAQVTPILIPDSVPDSINGGNPTLVVGGGSVVSTINHLADQDFYKVDLQAGVKYNVGMYSAVAGPSGVPLPDAYLELYDAQGRLVHFSDGGGRTPGGELYGLDAMMTFTVVEGGTFYVNARSFDNTTDDGSDNGDTIGDYEVFVEVNTDPPAEDTAYYSPSSPLRAIDWGTQVNKVHQSVRNPDGQEGPRQTGNPYEAPAGDALGYPGKNVITYYFAKQGEVFVDENPATVGLTATMVAKGFEQWEKDAYIYAFGEFAEVADIVYLEVDTKEAADFVLVTYTGTPGRGAPSLLGRMSPPDTENEGQTEFNAGDERWTEAGLAPGGFTFVTLIHELGHGHGLAHPHDNGGTSSIMNGVRPAGVEVTPGVVIPDPVGAYPDYTRGDHDLNQGVFTMMSYQDGWEASPYGQASTKAGYGWLGSLSPFDIAVIQDKYGVNEEYATGNDVYTLKDVNAPGTFWSAIWDAGGTDQIVYDGTRDTVIDLRPATLKYEVGGGGWLSYAWGIHGGFTIANGVTIENARSGAGNDVLNGNDAANSLDSGAGNDRLDGGGGADQMFGGRGDDVYVIDNAGDRANELYTDGGTDTVESSISVTLGGNLENLVLTGTGHSTGVGNGLANSLTGNDGNNVLNGAGGADTMAGGLGNDEYWIDDAADTIAENAGGGTDTVRSTISYSLGANLENLILSGTAAVSGTGNDGNNALTGNAAANALNGGLGNDTLTGAGGADTLAGGQGDDVYHIDSLDTLVEAAGEGTDTVHSAQTYTLQDNFENLVLTGNLNVAGTGNALNNVLTGNAGNNQLNGGAGADNMFGGRGNDTYIVDNAGDRASEVYTDGGTDLVLSSVSYTLAGNVENMNLTGADAINGTGNALANVINGNNANNVLTGNGGADTLNGGLGNDTYAYRSTSDSTAAAMDTIFVYKGDKIDLSVIDANTSASGNNAFAFVGAAAFSGTAGELRATGSGSSWTVEADVDGDGTADLMIAVTTNNIPLTSAEFVF